MRIENITKIWKAWRLYALGKQVERARRRLQRLYESGIGTDRGKMRRAIRQFNRLCDRFICLEEKINAVIHKEPPH